jgi:hypothetical protein
MIGFNSTFLDLGVSRKYFKTSSLQFKYKNKKVKSAVKNYPRESGINLRIAI